MISTPAPLTTIELENAAEVLEKQAKTLRTKARKLVDQMSQQQANETFLDALYQCGLNAAKANKWKKSNLDIAKCAEFFPAYTPKETVIHYTRMGCDAEKKRIRATRDREIMRRARLGETNAVIAKALDISTRTISTVITRELHHGQSALLEQTKPCSPPPRRRMANLAAPE